jgi:hypothetical protein
MKKIIDYTIIRGGILSELEDRVFSLLKEGWQPLGGIEYIEMGYGENSVSYFCQAMVRYEEDKV